MNMTLTTLGSYKGAIIFYREWGLWGGDQNFLGWSEGGPVFFSGPKGGGLKGGPEFFNVCKGGGPEKTADRPSQTDGPSHSKK